MNVFMFKIFDQILKSLNSNKICDTMQPSGYKKFCEGIQYKSIPFDNTLTNITKIIPLAEPNYIMVDSLFNIHVLKNPKVEPFKQVDYPTPPYASKSNPKVKYSIDPEKLYKSAYGREMEYDVKEAFLDFINSEQYDVNLQHNVFYLNPYAVVVQFYKKKAPIVLDLRFPIKLKLLSELEDAKYLCYGGDDWIYFVKRGPRNKEAVYIYSVSMRKMKKLNFKCPESEVRYKFHLACEDVLILETSVTIQFLDANTNKLIRLIPFMGSFNFQVNYESSLAMYNINDEILHVFEFKNGQIWNENKILLSALSDNDNYSPILLNKRRVLLIKGNKFMFFRLIRLNLVLDDEDSNRFERTQEFNALCCSIATKDPPSYQNMKIFLTKSEDFYLLNHYCSWDKTHGLQQVHFCNISIKRHHPHNSIQVNFTQIFSESKDPVVCLSLANDKKSAVFITERARFFQLDLKSYKVKFFGVIEPLLRYLIESRTKIKTISGLYHHKEKGYYVITVPLQSKYQSTFIYSQETFELINACNSAHINILSLTSNQGIIVALSEQDLGGVTSYYISILEKRGYSKSEARFKMQQKVPDKICNIFPDLYVVSDSTYQNLYLYDDLLQLTGSKMTKLIFGDSFVEKSIILDAKAISDKLYLLMGQSDERFTLAIMNKEEVVRRLMGFDMLKFVVRISDEMIFFKNMGQGVIFRARTSELLKQDSSLEDYDEEYVVDDFDYEEDIERYRLEDETFKYIEPFKSCIGYERYHNRNAICLYREYNIKLEMLILLKKTLGNHYHAYTMKMVFEMLNLGRLMRAETLNVDLILT
jgi:hypothetical protein